MNTENQKPILSNRSPDVDVPKILEEAKEKGFTRYGEMFSAFDMATLAESYFELEAKVVDQFTVSDIAHHLSQGYLVLIP